MDTSQIELAANRGDIATADFNIGLALRSQVIPLFLSDVGRVGWRRLVFTVKTAAGVQEYDLPENFAEVDSVYLDGQREPLPFIGEDASFIAQASVSTASDSFSGYYVKRSLASTSRFAVCFAAPAAAEYTLRVFYYFRIPFEDDSQDIDLSQYVPQDYHWAIVELLRREIYDDRYGQGDQRYLAADAKYQSWIQKITLQHELGPKGYIAHYVR